MHLENGLERGEVNVTVDGTNVTRNGMGTDCEFSFFSLAFRKEDESMTGWLGVG